MCTLCSCRAVWPSGHPDPDQVGQQIWAGDQFPLQVVSRIKRGSGDGADTLAANMRRYDPRAAKAKTLTGVLKRTLTCELNMTWHVC